MKFPNKVIGINESIMPLLVKLIRIISLGPIAIPTLYNESKIGNISLFAEALTCLYALNKIKLNDRKEVELC